MQIPNWTNHAFIIYRYVVFPVWHFFLHIQSRVQSLIQSDDVKKKNYDALLHINDRRDSAICHSRASIVEIKNRFGEFLNRKMHFYPLDHKVKKNKVLMKKKEK